MCIYNIIVTNVFFLYFFMFSIYSLSLKYFQPSMVHFHTKISRLILSPQNITPMVLIGTIKNKGLWENPERWDEMG